MKCAYCDKEIPENEKEKFCSDLCALNYDNEIQEVLDAISERES